MKTQSYQLRFDTLILRFYLMMAVVILSGFLNMWVLSLLALPIFLTCLMGTSFTTRKAPTMVSDTKAVKSTKAHVRAGAISSHQIRLEA
jgi:hypothetical protein